MKTQPIDLVPAANGLTTRQAALTGAGLLALASLLATTSGCVVTVRPVPEPVVYAAPPGEVTVDVAPPAPIVEAVGVAPGPGFFWIGGYYHWYGNRWGWVAGHYERPPHHGAVWVGPRYEFRGGRRVYIRGYWR
jgi:hypothetical protein